MDLQVRLMHERGYQLGNVDVTIIAQKPKLSPHKEKMRDQLCHLIGSHPSTVNIKVKLTTVQICKTMLQTLLLMLLLCHCGSTL